MLLSGAGRAVLGEHRAGLWVPPDVVPPAPRSPAITVNQGEMSSPQRVAPSQQQTRISASSATRELDELMASLSDFKVPRGPSSFPPVSPRPSAPTPRCEELALGPAAWVPCPEPGTPQCPGLAREWGGQARLVGAELPPVL